MLTIILSAIAALLISAFIRRRIPNEVQPLLLPRLRQLSPYRVLYHYPLMGILGTTYGALLSMYIGSIVPYDTTESESTTLREKFPEKPGTTSFLLVNKNRATSSRPEFDYCYYKHNGNIACVTFSESEPRTRISFGYATEHQMYTRTESRRGVARLFTFDGGVPIVYTDIWFQAHIDKVPSLT